MRALLLLLVPLLLLPLLLPLLLLLQLLLVPLLLPLLPLPLLLLSCVALCAMHTEMGLLQMCLHLHGARTHWSWVLLSRWLITATSSVTAITQQSNSRPSCVNV